MYEASIDQGPPHVGSAPEMPTQPLSGEGYDPEEFANLLDQDGGERVAPSAEDRFEPPDQERYEPEEYANLLDEDGNARVARPAQSVDVRDGIADERGRGGNEVSQPPAPAWKRGIVGGTAPRADDVQRPGLDAEGEVPDGAPAVDASPARRETKSPPPMQREPKLPPKFDPRPNVPQPQRPALQRQPPPKYQPPSRQPSAPKPAPSQGAAPKSSEEQSRAADRSARPDRVAFKAHVLGQDREGRFLVSTAKPDGRAELIALPRSVSNELANDKQSRRALEKSYAFGDEAPPLEISKSGGKWSARDTSRDAIRMPKNSIA